VRRSAHIERLRASLRRAITAERQLLRHSFFSIGAVKEKLRAHANLRRLERFQPNWH
jgi:hypothetical protein